MENKNYSLVTAPGAAPYLQSLLSQYASATNYHGLSHPSAPNYIALTCGQLLQVGSDACSTYTVPSIFDQLELAGVSWSVYSENQGVDPKKNATPYACRHNPGQFYSRNLAGGRLAKLKNFTAFHPGTESLQFVIPNINDDMHTGTIAQGDAWLKAHVPAMLATGALVVVVFDEGDGDPTNHVACLFAGKPAARVSSAKPYTHYNLLATLEDMFALPRLGGAIGAAPMSDMLGGSTPPGPTPITSVMHSG